MVVEIGLTAQPEKDCWIRNPATVKPVRTTNIQNSLLSRLVVEMWDKPWIVEDSRKSLIAVSMLMVYGKLSGLLNILLYFNKYISKCPMSNTNIELLIEH